MFAAHKDRVEFFIVYIREAHPIDGHLPMVFGLIEDPVTLVERMQVAKRCVAGMKVEIPAIVDKMDDAVNLAYGGWPERLYLVDVDGKIAFAGGPGPFGFIPDQLGEAIERLLARGAEPAAKRSGR